MVPKYSPIIVEAIYPPASAICMHVSCNEMQLWLPAKLSLATTCSRPSSQITSFSAPMAKPRILLYEKLLFSNYTLFLSKSFSEYPLPYSTRPNSYLNFDCITLNKKISHFIRTNRINDAKSLFDAMMYKTVVSWNAMITGYARRGEITKARQLFDEMPERDVKSWNIMISGYVSCRGNGFIEEARKLFEEMPARDSVTWNAMISGCAKAGRIKEAEWYFENMPERNVVSWNAMISGFLSDGNVARAVELFQMMPERDSSSLSVIVSGLIQNGELDEAAKVLIECGCRGSGREDMVHAYNTLIAGYGQRGHVEEARRVFDQIPDVSMRGRNGRKGFVKNVVSWNTMIMSYVRAGNIDSARALFDKMPERDTFSWNTIMTAYVNASEMEEAANLFRRMPAPDILSWNLMMSGYANIGALKEAQEFFEWMPKKNRVSWNSLIAAYEKNEDFKGAIMLFLQMLLHGEKPDQHTLSSVLTVCAGLVDLHLGMQIHQMIVKTVCADVHIKNALITMYSRCGVIAEARMIFDEVKAKRDVISWNAMIGAYASHGFAAMALELFESMKRLHAQPTYITFISVLHACAYAGLVEEGRKYFELMVIKYGIQPRMEHFALIVDLVGRHGQLDEAMDIIKGMPFEPGRTVWGALLGACRVQNNVNLAQIAVEALIKLEPESSAPYVLLYNTYADVGRWDEAIEVRSMMDKGAITKQLGYSRVG